MPLHPIPLAAGPPAVPVNENGALLAALVSKTLLEDWEDQDFVNWSRTDNFSIVSTDVPSGSYAAGVDANNFTSEQYLIATQSDTETMGRAFLPGDVARYEYMNLAGAHQFYFGDQDTTPSNQYEFSVEPGGGTDGAISVRKNDAGTDTTLYQDIYPTGLSSGSGDPGYVYVYWRPDAIKSDPMNSSSPSGDGAAEGDFYVEVQDSDHTPKVSAYVNADDITFTNGGLGWAVGGSNHNHVDDLTVGDLGAFSNFTPSDHLPDTNEIAFFQTGDLTAWHSSRRKYEIIDPSTLASPFSPKKGSYVLNFIAGEGFDLTHSAPGSRSDGQKRDLFDYIADGEKGRCWARATGVTDEQYVGCCSDGTDNNYVRVELEHDQRIRLVEVLTGTTTVINDTSLTLNADAWYSVVFDRTTAGDLTATVNDDTGTQVWSHTYTLPSGLVGNSGLVIGGYTPSSIDYYFDGWEKL